MARGKLTSLSVLSSDAVLETFLVSCAQRDELEQTQRLQLIPLLEGLCHVEDGAKDILAALLRPSLLLPVAPLQPSLASVIIRYSL
jgi:hypothetical protein